MVCTQHFKQHPFANSRLRLATLILTLLAGALNSTWANSATPVDRHQHTVIADGHPLTVWEKTPTQATAVILLIHGRTWSSVPDFDLQVPGESLSFMDGLNALGYAVYALDARGYGATPRDSSGWLTPDQATRDATRALAWIKTRTDLDIHLYGWSYGSMVSQLVVQRAPNSVKSVMLFGYPFNPARHIIDPNFKYPTQAPAAANTAANAASDFIVPGAISQTAIDTYVAAALLADPYRVDFKNLHEWAELDPSLITTPTLLLQGEFDPLAGPADLPSFFDHIKTADKWWVVLADGDHAALLEKPRGKMLQAIDSFIQSLTTK